MENSADWRRILAALGNRDARLVFARIVLGADRDQALEGLTPAKGRRALEALTSAGLVAAGGGDGRGGQLTVDDAVFSSALRSQSDRPKRTGADRFFTDDGRLDRYPAGLAERIEVLAIVADQILRPDEIVGEAEITERLARFTDDPALLRRQLVDHELVERTRSGSEYARVAPPR